MERKYYLRGLGLGIVVTAVIMSVALPDSQAMSNDEIIARAKELGLVENTVLSNMSNSDDSQDNEDDDRADDQDAVGHLQNDLTAGDSVIDTGSETGDTAAKEDIDAADEAEAETALEANNPGQEDANPENAAAGENPESEDIPEEKEQENTTVREENKAGTNNANGVIPSATVKVITINSGDSSYTAAKKLADAGAVISAEDFDTFLCQNGYDKRLRTGNFSIPANASDEQIARIITGLE